MDNWDYFQENLSVAYDSVGELNKQAEIYAESWEASRDRVQAALEGIYDSLIDEEFFIKLNDLLTTLLTGIEKLIDGFGGLGGIIPIVAGLFATTFKDKIADSVDNTIIKVKSLTKSGKKELMGLKDEASSQLSTGFDDKTPVGGKVSEAYGGLVDTEKQLADIAGKISSEKAKELGYMLEQHRIRVNDLANLGREVKYQEEKTKLLEKQKAEVLENIGLSKEEIAAVQADMGGIAKNQQAYISLSHQAQSFGQNEYENREQQDAALMASLENYSKDSNLSIEDLKKEVFERVSKIREDNEGKTEKQIQELIAADLTEHFNAAADLQSQVLNDYVQNFDSQKMKKDQQLELNKKIAEQEKRKSELEEKKKSLDPSEATKNGRKTNKQDKTKKENLKEVEEELQSIEKELAENRQKLTNVTTNLNESEEEQEKRNKAVKQALEPLAEQYIATSEAVNTFNEATENVNASNKKISEETIKAEQQTFKTGEAFVFAAEAATNLVAVGSGLKSIGNIWSDEESSALDKMTQSMAVMASIMPSTLELLQKDNLIKARNLFLTKAGTKAIAEAGGVSLKSASSLKLLAGAVNWWVVGIAAAVAAVVALVVIIDRFRTKAKRALAEAEKKSQELTESLDSAKSSAQELKDAFDGYDEIKNKLNNCTKGTKEWNEALKENNDYVMKLIQKYPQLLNMVNDKGEKAVSTDSSGKMSIADWAIEQAMSSANAMVEAASGAKTQSDQDVYNKRVEAEKEAIKNRNFDEKYHSYTIYDDNGVAQASGGMNLFTNSEFDTILQNADILNSRDEEYILQKLAELLPETYARDDIGRFSAMAELIASEDFNNAIQPLVLALNANTNATVENTGHAATLLGDNETVQNSKYTKELIEGTGATYKNFYEEAQKKYADVGDETIQAAYLSAFSGSVSYENGKYYDASGKEISVDTMREQLIANEANKRAEDNVDNLEAVYSELDKAGLGSLITLLNTKNIDDISLSDYEKLKEQENWSQYGIDEEFLKAYGIDSIEAFLESPSFNFEDTSNDIKNRLTSVDNKTGTNLSGLSNVLDANEAKQVEAAILQTYESKGQAATSYLNTILNENKEDAGKIAQVVNSIDDWTDEGVVDALKTSLDEQSVSVDLTSSSWQGFINQMQVSVPTTDKLISSITKLGEKLAAVDEIIKNIKIGDIVKDEDFEILKSYNSEIADLFMKTASGDWQFIGDVDELNDKLKISKDNIKVYQQDLEEARNLGQHLKSQDKDWLSLSSSNEIDTKTAESMYKKSEYEIFLGDMNLSESAFKDYLDRAANNPEDTEAINKVREYYKTVANYQQKYEEGLFNDSVLSSMAATQAEDFDELNELLKDNIVTIEDYNKQKLRMIQIEHEASDIDLDTWEDYAEYLEENNDLLKGNSKQAKIVASAVLRLNKGLDDIQENYSDWNKAILNASENSREYVTAMTGMRNAVADVLNVSNDYVSNDFIVEHLNDIKLAAEGDIAAIERLRVAFVENIAGEEVFSEIKDEFLDFQNFLLTNPLELGAKLDNHSFIDACNQMIASGKMTALQVQEAFKSLGFDVELNSVTVPVPEVKRVRGKRKEGIDPRAANDPDFFEWSTETTYRDVVVTGVKFITSTGSTGGNIDYTNTKAGGAAIKESSDKPSKMDRTKRSDVVDRYKEISDSIDDLTDALEDANKQADRLYGANRLQKMKQQNKLIQDEIGLLKRKKSEALGYLASDRGALNAAASAAGASFTYDASGNITNYTQEMNRLYDQLSAAEAAFNSMGSKDAQESYQEKTLDPLQKKIDDLKDYLSQYEETRELIEDLDNEIDDKFYEWQDNNYEQLTYALELDIEINDLQLEKVEYYLNKMADDFYSMAESAALIASKMPITESSLKSQEEFYNGITQAYANGEISQSAYIEGLKETYSGMLNQLSTLNDLDKEMMAYYGETLSAANDEIDKHVSKIEHLNSILDHYKNILGILGETTNYKALGGILEGQAKVIKNELDVAVATYNMYKNEVDMWQEKMNSAVKNSEAWEVYKTNWEAALEASNQAQEEMLAKTEEWAEAMKAIIENNLSDYAQSLENTLTGGTSFDQMTTSLERAASLQEEYLTATNQLYETTKLMRTAQTDLDKTSNITAKNKIKAFIEETAQLQEQGKLSNYELEIQQAKYNLLVAEIALKDAQDAKNIVRLQRDSEGNFGYVYTADQDKVAQAQQQFEDAQNNLYNIGLRGANDYTQKYQQTLAQMYDTLTQLQEKWLNGEFESEQEYQNAVLEAKQYYYDLLGQYSELYQISLTTHSEVARDAWGADFEQMTMNTDQWMLATDDYLSQVEQEFRNWGDVVEEVKNYVGEDLTESQNKVQDVIDTSQELTDQALNEVIPAINSELDAVGDLTAAFAAQRGELKNLMGYYENLLNVISSTITQHKNLTSAAQEAQKAIQAAQVAGNQYHSNTGNGGNGGNGKEKGDTDPPYIPSSTPKYRWFRVDHDESNTHGIQNQQTGTFFSDAQLTQKGYVIGETYGNHNNGNGIGIEVLSLKRIKDKTYMSLSNIDKFDTGGYTGVWGQSGKLAMLHEKELVLNKEDTSNLLFTVEMVRDIIRSIDLNALSSQYGGLRSPGYSSGSTGILEQSVVIEANFPSVTERGEIEEAFKNLINTASQYANRK